MAIPGEATSSFFTRFKYRNDDGVIQFRGIQYASLTDQLSVAEMVTSYGDKIVDATSFGPRAPAIDGCAFEQSMLIQCSIDSPVIAPPMCGTRCLNLNVTIPARWNLLEMKLPVMVFIHGGGYVMGANYWPQYDPSRLVRLSAKLEKPVIAVNINYRLGVLGNLTSQELKAAGYPGNNSLRDQKCALQWIKANIERFGGDPDNVTACGVSNGAAAVLYLLQSKEPLFKRCISMSGTPIMFKPLPLAVAETSYQSVMKELGLEYAPVEERIMRLRNIKPEELVSKRFMGMPCEQFLDGELVHEATTFAKLATKNDVAGRSWCKQLMIGDCQHDGSLFPFMGLAQRKAGIAKAITASLRTHLNEAAATAVLEGYGLHTTTDDDRALNLIVNLATDISFFAPALAYARWFGSSTFYYHFNEPNPWKGPFQGQSSHMLDAAFLFQNFNEHMPSETRWIAEMMAKHFIQFVNGVEPWDSFEEDVGNVQIYGPSFKGAWGTVKNSGFGHGRRDVLMKLSDEGILDLDQLRAALELFMTSE